MMDPTIIAPAIGPSEAEEDRPLSVRPKKRERLEFALPTINVIFLLMLYFLVAGTIVQRDELSVVPPETSQAPNDRLPRPLLLISNDGAFFLDGRAVARSDLVAESRAVLEGPGLPDRQINILAPAGMQAASFFEVLAGFAAANVPVRLVTVEPEAAGEPE